MTEQNFPNPNSLDFTDLLEYDEFDVYDKLLPSSDGNGQERLARRPCTDQLCCSSNDKVEGVPLSVELSEVQDKSNDDEPFVKAPELFLRFDGASGDDGGSSGSGVRFRCSVNDNNSCETPVNNDCVELQYENEFDDDDDDVDGNSGFLQFTEATKSYHSMNENENEQLLLEGIFFMIA